MNLAMFNESDCSGGAARAAYRFHTCFIQKGISSAMGVARKTGQDPSVTQLVSKAGRLGVKAGHLLSRLSVSSVSGAGMFSTAEHGIDPASSSLLQDADIIVLHWVPVQFLSMKGIKSVLKLGKPVVWVLHDMWPVTGGCHYAGDCTRFMNSCGSCPLLGSEKENDRSAEQLESKSQMYRGTGLTFIAPSLWMKQQAEKSSLARGHDVLCIYNGLDTERFSPGDQVQAKTDMGLSPDRPLILFGGADAAGTERKGFSFFLSALETLSADRSSGVLPRAAVFGSEEKSSLPKQKGDIPIQYLGMLDDEKLIQAYRAADVFVLPSLADNLPNTALESLACGVPVAGFSSGGIPEIIEHGVSGYLSAPGDGRELARGIQWVLSAGPGAAGSARERALQKFDIYKQALEYEALFKTLGSEEKGRI